MSNPIEPLPSTPNGHAGGDVASEELVGHGHFVTHFDEPSLDYGVTETKITEATREELRSIAARYPEARSALLPMLHLVQSAEGRVTPAGIEVCAEILGLTAAEVSGVATFYTMYKRRPVGDYHVGVCTTALCAIMGGDEVYSALQDHLGIGNDETTEDGLITLEHIECNAACDFAPVMMVNWEFFDNTTPQKATEVVDQLRSGVEVQSHVALGCVPGRRPSGCSLASPTNVPTKAPPPSDRRCSACALPSNTAGRLRTQRRWR